MASAKMNIFVSVMCFLKLILLMASFLSRHWAEGTGNHFGLLKYCADNATSCQIVTDKLHTVEVPLKVSLAAVAVSWFMNALWLIVCLALFCECCCKEREKDQPFYIIMAIIIVASETVALSAFGIVLYQLLEVYYVGYSFYCAVASLVLTVLYILLLILTCTSEKCKACCWHTSSVEDSSVTKESAHTRHYDDKEDYPRKKRRVTEVSGHNRHHNDKEDYQRKKRRERDFVFTEKPRDVHVMVNESVSVRACVPNANNVYWCKGGDKVHAISTSFTEDFDEPYASLTLKNARLHDQGEYICVAEKYGNETKRIRSRFTINVNEGDSPLEGKVNPSRAFDVERTVRKSRRKIKKKHHDEDYEDSLY
ncbi:uncharacterized protein LOC111099876 [Crassostrea virginica]